MPYREAAEMPKEKKTMKQKLIEAWNRFEKEHKTAANHILFFFRILWFVALLFSVVGAVLGAALLCIFFGVWFKFWSIPLILVWIAFCITVGRAVAPLLEKYID